MAIEITKSSYSGTPDTIYYKPTSGSDKGIGSFHAYYQLKQNSVQESYVNYKGGLYSVITTINNTYSHTVPFDGSWRAMPSTSASTALAWDSGGFFNKNADSQGGNVSGHYTKLQSLDFNVSRDCNTQRIYLRFDLSIANSRYYSREVSEIADYGDYITVPELRKVNIVYHANGGSTPSGLTVYCPHCGGTHKSYGKSASIGVNSNNVWLTPTKANYTFKGWSTSSTATDATYTASNHILWENGSPSNNYTVDLYAVWAPKQYTITVKAATKTSESTTGGTAQGSGNYNYNSSASISGTAKTGYHFEGFKSTPTAGTYLSRSNPWSVSVTGAATYYAVFLPNKYSIKYNANGGSGTMSDSTGIEYGADFTLKSNTFTAPISGGGYSFIGWSTSLANAQAGTVISNSKVNSLTSTDGGSVTVYACWRRTITFKYGQNSSSSKDVYQYYNASVKNSSTPTAITGWTFKGYRNDTNASTKAYSDANNNGFSYADASRIFYAIYDRTVTQNYNANGGGTPSKTTENGTQYYNSANTISTVSFTTPAAPTAPSGGYSFYRWGTTTTGGTTYSASSAANFQPGVSSSASRTLYAIWTRELTYNSGANNATHPTETQYYGSNISIPAPASITGWTALGYRTDTTPSTKTHSSGSQAYTGSDRIFYAVYSRTVTITYDGGGNTGGTKPTDTTLTQYYNSNNSVSSHSVTLRTNSYTKTGYTFNGWSGDVSGSSGGNATVSPSRTASANLTATATWVANTYYVEYNSNRGTGSISRSTHTYDQEKQLSPNTFTRVGYTYLGWSTSSTATSPMYSDKQSVKNLTATPNGTVVLYAIWRPNDYTVGLDHNDMKGNTSSIVVTFDSSRNNIIQLPYRPDFQFLGYYDSSDRLVYGEDGKFVNGVYWTNGTWTYPNNLSLHAMWKDLRTVHIYDDAKRKIPYFGGQKNQYYWENE